MNVYNTMYVLNNKSFISCSSRDLYGTSSYFLIFLAFTNMCTKTLMYVFVCVCVFMIVLVSLSVYLSKCGSMFSCAGVYFIRAFLHWENGIQLPGRTSVGRAGGGADLAGCGSVAGKFPSSSGDLPPRLLPPFEGGWVDRPASEAPLIRGMPTGP